MFNNARQAVPPVFTAIIKNDQAREDFRDAFVAGAGTQGMWRQLRELISDRKNLRAGAERAMRWNVDKGSAA